MAYQPNDDPGYVPDDKLSDHCYDGIQEYDNPTPGWWNWLFWGTIDLAPLYLIVFHSPNLNIRLSDQYAKAYAENLRLQFGEIGTLEPTAETILQYMHDPKWIAVGEATFQTNCVTCHGKDGQGISGPNLTDNAYKNVKKIDDIATVIHDGAQAGAMPAWGNRLHPNEMVLAAAYVASLRGKNAAGGKNPEGNEIPPWPEQAKAK